MVANDRPKQRNAGSNLNQLILKEKENDGVNAENDNCNEEQDKQNVIPIGNDEEEPSIDFYNMPES